VQLTGVWGRLTPLDVACGAHQAVVGDQTVPLMS